MTSDHFRLLALVARLITVALVAACVWMLTPAHADAAGVPLPAVNRVRLVACAGGTTRAVIVRAAMVARSDARRMAMRFALLRTTASPAAPGSQEAAPGALRPVALAVPAWAGWTRAAPGRRAFVVMRRLDGLTGPAVYTVRVTMRWLDRRGHAVKTTTIDAAPCSQPDPRPDLLFASARFAASSAIVVDVANQGWTRSAGGSVVVLSGAGEPPAPLGSVALAPIAARAQATVVIPIDGVCTVPQTVRLVIETVGELDYGNNALDLSCPPSGALEPVVGLHAWPLDE